MIEQLVDKINAKIKANGKNQITGSVLNEVMLAIVGEISGKTAFGGVITPESISPQTTDSIFFVATEPGVYEHFSDITIGESEYAFILRSGNEWVKYSIHLPQGPKGEQGEQGIGFQTITTAQDGTIVITLTNGEEITIDLNHQHPNQYSKKIETTQPLDGMLPDTIYKLGTLTGNVTFLFAQQVNGNVNHYYFIFDSGSASVIPTWPSSIVRWGGNCIDDVTGLPVIVANKTYEVSVINGNAVIKEW